RKPLRDRDFSIRCGCVILWMECAWFRIAGWGEIARVRPMNEIAPGTSLGTNLLPDADAAGAPGLRPGTTGILPYQSLVQMVRAGDIKGVPHDLEPDQ